VYYYEAVVRPVLEYVSPVWHASLTADQTKTLEAVQRRACQIITGGRTYTENCALLQLENLADRRDWQPRKLFNGRKMNNPRTTAKRPGLLSVVIELQLTFTFIDIVTRARCAALRRAVSAAAMHRDCRVRLGGAVQYRSRDQYWDEHITTQQMQLTIVSR